MAKEIRTEIDIKASPEKIWKILLDFNNYPNWNPFIKSVKGKAAVGNKLSIRVQPIGQKQMKFNPEVQSVEVNHSFIWQGHFIIPGLFDGKHQFMIEELANGKSRFIHSESFKGILVPLFNLDSTIQGFKLMNNKLKEIAERA